ncbi:MAG TPA: tetratricopeptide repeat protein [Geobacteraceae bacterium]
MNGALPSSSSPQRAIRRLRPHLPALLLLVAASLAVYLRALGHDFLVNWDDPEYVTANDMIRGLTFAHIRQAFTTFHFSNYAPLHLVSYMVDYELWGLKPAGFILTNIILHTVNAVVFYFLLVKLAARRLPAFVAAAIFLLHPVQVESVVWVAERKNLLAMTFFILTLHAWGAWRERERAWWYYVGALAAFVCALFAKSVTVVLPAVLFLYDGSFVSVTGWKKRLTPLLPFAFFAIAIALLALVSHAPEVGGGRTPFHGGSPRATFLTMLPVMVAYVGLLLRPTQLRAVYDPVIRTAADSTAVLAALCVAACLGGLFILRHRRRDLFFWGALYAVCLLPVMQIVPIATLMNDRYLYFPMLGAAALVAFGLSSLVDARSRSWQRGAGALAVLLLAALGVLAWERVAVWQNAVTLWRDAVLKTPTSKVACYSLAGAYTQTGGMRTAAECFSVGEAFRRAGFPERALPVYERGLFFDPTHRDTLFSAALLHLERGDATAAFPYLLRLQQAHPAYAEGYAALALAHVLAGRGAEGAAALGRALRLGVVSAEGMRLMGDVYLRLFRLDEARRWYNAAIARGPEDGVGHYRLSLLAAVQGRRQESLDELARALRLGYPDRASFIFHPLRQTTAFQDLVARYPRD